MFHFTYKTTNTINGKFYYGFHSTENVNDSYLGSGVAINRAIKKYGKSYFKREIIQFFSSFEELVEGEINLVTQSVVDDPMCYNMQCGGLGAAIGHYVSDETKEKQSLAQMGNTKWLGKKHKPETKQKIRESKLGIAMHENSRKALKEANTGRVQPPEEREKKSKALRGKKKGPEHCAALKEVWKLRRINGTQASNTKIWELEYNGNIIVVPNMINFCKDNNLSYQSFASNGKHKGYTVLRKYRPNAS